MVDVLIQTFNEEINLPHTLASVQGWVNRVFVVDSGSTDRTTEIAREYGAEVVHHAWEGYAAQKNWALDNLPFVSPWILILDADEAVSPQLRDEIARLTSRPVEEVPEAGFYINRVFVFMGRKIRHCGYFPSWNLRLFKRGRARYENRLVHEHMVVDGASGYLKGLMIHEDRRGLEHFFAKHNRYSSLEAREIYESPEPWPGLKRIFTDRIARRRFGKSRILPYLPVPWVWRLIYMFIFRAGFLDFRAGWYLCNFIASYEFSIQLKFRELKRLAGKRVAFGGGLAEAEGSSRYAEDRVVQRPAGQGAVSPGVSASAILVPQAVPGNGAELRLPVNHERLFTEADERLEQLADRSAATAPEPEGIPTLLRGRDNIHRFSSPWTLRQNIARVLWMVTAKLLFRPSFHNWYGWRRLLLKTFGAKVGRHVRIRPTAHIEIPWNLDIGDSSIIGDHAIIYSLGKIIIGRRVVVSQYAHLCAGTHDYRYRDFPLLKPPILIGDEAWIAADAFVGPGVTVGRQAILGARASAFSDLPEGMICVGNPAKAIKEREFVTDAAPTPDDTKPHGSGGSSQSALVATE